MCDYLPNGGFVENRLTGLAFMDRSKNFYAINTFQEDSGQLRAGRMTGKISESKYEREVHIDSGSKIDHIEVNARRLYRGYGVIGLLIKRQIVANKVAARLDVGVLKMIRFKNLIFLQVCLKKAHGGMPPRVVELFN